MNLGSWATYPPLVLLQLMRCTCIFAGFFLILMFVPLLLDAWTGRCAVADRCSMIHWFAPAWPNILIGAQLATFATFRGYFWPRFPDAPALLTFVLAASFCSGLFAVALAIGGSGLDAYWNWVLKLCAVSAVGGMFDRFSYYMGGGQGAPFATGRWIGWLFVGRTAYDRFVGQEAARMHHEFESYRKEIGQKTRDSNEG